MSVWLFLCCISVIGAKKPYNVLFVVVDDLRYSNIDSTLSHFMIITLWNLCRTELGGPYGQNDLVYTPNFEAIMDRAFTFTQLNRDIYIINSIIIQYAQIYSSIK